VAKLLPPEKQGSVNLKWPNDVLVGDDKVSGLLIEMDGGGHYLVGIGVNLAQAPAVPDTGVDRGRAATSLAAHGARLSAESARELSLAIATAVAEWFGRRAGDGAEAVRAEWEGMAVWGREYRLREDGSVVVPLGLEEDGQLRVRDPATGAVKYLVAEYLH
jgi:BirA family transcriptional regulator, biotin operon repressor / biotin---[acetyl-CoA-carboxylase] ligase